MWPYSGKRYIQMFPPLPNQQPQQQSPHMPPPVPQQMPPPPAYEENPEAAQQARFIYYPPYPYPAQVGFVGTAVSVVSWLLSHAVM